MKERQEELNRKASLSKRLQNGSGEIENHGS